MHTAEALTAEDFRYLSGDRSVERDEVMPTISPNVRLGVVMGDGLDGIGAGNFILSCVTAFYDRLRAEREDFFEYPEYYTIQATADPADYRMLDVWPDHKNVAVEPDAEELLRAINDRAIDVLLVPDGPTRTPDLDDVSRRSAERRIDDCYLYAPDGQLDDPAFSIGLPMEPVRDWYEATVDSVSRLASANGRKSFTPGAAVITQRYRRVSLEQGLSRLPVGTTERRRPSH